jgi:hypothetical protein
VHGELQLSVLSHRPGCIKRPHGCSDEKNVNRLTSTTRKADPV